MNNIYKNKQKMKLFFNDLIQNNFHFTIQFTYAVSDTLSAGRRLYWSKIRSVTETTIVNLSQFGGIRISTPINAILTEFDKLYVIVAQYHFIILFIYLNIFLMKLNLHYNPFSFSVKCSAIASITVIITPKPKNHQLLIIMLIVM